MVEHINVQDGGYAVDIATNVSGYGFFNPNEIEINNGTFETEATNGGAIRLCIYDGKFYMLGDVLLNDYIGEIYEIPKSISGTSCTMKKVVVKNNKVVSASGKIESFEVIATLGNVDDANENEIPSENTNMQNIIKKDSNTNIKLEAQSGVIPNNTTIDVKEIESSETLDKIKNKLTNIENFKAFDINLKSEGINIQPNGKVKLSIPIPETFDKSKLIVYRFEEDGNKTEYKVQVNNNYASFETDHFSTYILGEKTTLSEGTQGTTNENNKELPQTGEKNNPFVICISITIAISILILVSMLVIDYKRNKKTTKKIS